MAKTIDIERALRDKLGRRMRYVPNCLVNWLRRIAHEDRLNDFAAKAAHLEGSAWLRAAIDYLDLKIEVIGLENLPTVDSTKRYTIVSNHPMDGIDGIVLGAIVGERTNDKFRYLINDLLMQLPGLKPLSIPINKTGAQGRNLPEIIRQAFESDYHIMMFPAGLCSRLIDGRVQDIPWTKAFIQRSVETGRDIIPIYFEGQNSMRFYRIARLCSWLHLKVNIAMLFLVDEMFRQEHGTFRVYVGKPIPVSTFDSSRSPLEWAQFVRAEVYRLKGKS